MDPQAKLILFIAGGGILGVVLYDLWKKQLVRRKQQLGKKVPEHWKNNSTDWRMIAAIAIVLVIVLYLRHHPEFVENYKGPFGPLVRHFLEPF